MIANKNTRNLVRKIYKLFSFHVLLKNLVKPQDLIHVLCIFND